MAVWTRRCLYLALAVVAGYALLRLRPDSPGSPSARPPAEPPSVLRGVKLMDEDVDGTRWTLTASSGKGWEGEGTGKLDDVTAVFEKGGRKFELHAASGEASRGEEVSVAGGVKLSWSDFVATTDRATYFRGKGLVRSEAAVSLAGRGLKVEGVGFEVDVEGRQFRVLSNVRATVGGSKP